MPPTRLRIPAPYLPPESLAHANERQRQLGASSLSVLFEALLSADHAAPIPGLAARVAEIEQGLTAGKANRGRATLPAAREARRKATSSVE
jgi:hypothetical protein